MLDPFADDSSSTNEEIQRLWEKLDTMESSGQLEREEHQCHREVSTPPPFAEMSSQITPMVVTTDSKAKQKVVGEQQQQQSLEKMPKLPPFYQTLSLDSSSSSSSSLPIVLNKDKKEPKKEIRATDGHHKNEKGERSQQNQKAQVLSKMPTNYTVTNCEPKSGDSDSSTTTSSDSSSSSSSASSSSSSSEEIPARVAVKSEPPMTVEVHSESTGTMIHSPLSMPQFGTQSPAPIKARSVKMETKSTAIENITSRKSMVASTNGDNKLAIIKNPYMSRKKQTKDDQKSKSSKLITSTASLPRSQSSSPFFKETVLASKQQRGEIKVAAPSITNKENKIPNKNTAKDATNSASTSESDSSSSPSSSPPKRANPIDSLEKVNQLNRGPDPLDVMIQDYQPEAEPSPEIDPSLLAPPRYKEKPRPVLHQFSLENRPLQSRTKVSVATLFPAPMNQLWRNKFKDFNHLQSEVANMLCHSDDNMVVSAPTGAGKTAIFEMALARFISRDLQFHRPFTNGPPSMSKHRKVVYFSPSKALCEERYEDWSQRLSQLQLGIEVSMITGDAEPGRSYHDLANAHLILTTPEKWDSILRRWTEHFFLVASVKLLLLDEVHLLGDPSRGFCLEAVITRMKHIHSVSQKVQISQAGLSSTSYKNTSPEAISACLRIIAVSATLPNILDVAEFLGANEAFSFDESYRPVPLETRVVGLGYIGKNEYRFWTNLDEQIPHLIARYADRKPTLIFCHTKKETESLAKHLISKNFGNNSNTSAAPPGSVQYCLDSGVAYHHAGVQASERRSIERAFANKTLQCLCATSTLAVGVNLPAHLVIIKGTRTWRGGGAGYQEIDSRSLLQMIGRAGRPGLDTSGTAIIMTDNASKLKYESLARGLGSADSQMIPKLIDVVNTEISQRVIQNIDDAVRWLKTTFLFACLKGNPPRFGVDLQSQTLDDFILSQCSHAIESLCKCGLVGGTDNIIPLAGSHIMSQSMVPFESMKMIAALPFDATQCQVLRMLSSMEDLHVPVRRLEKKPLNACHKSEAIRYKLEGPLSKVRIQDPSEKAFVLLQAYIAHEEFENYTLRQEMSTLADTAQCVLMAAQEHSTRGSMHGQVALQCLKLRRSLQLCLWGESSGVLNQIQDIGQKCTAQLKMNGIVSFEQAMAATEDHIERASGRPKPFGKRLHTIISKILQEKLTMTAEIEYTRESNIPASVQCHLRFPSQVPYNSNSEKAKVNYTLLSYTDRPGSMLFFQDGITGPGSYRFSCPTNFGKIFLHLFSSVVGLDANCILGGNQKAQPSTFVPSSKKVPPKSIMASGKKQQQKKMQDFSSSQTSKTSRVKDSRNHGKARNSPFPPHSNGSGRSQGRAPLGSKTSPKVARNEAMRRGTKAATPPTQMLPKGSIRVLQNTGGYIQNPCSQNVPDKIDRCHPEDDFIIQVPLVPSIIRDSRRHAAVVPPLIHGRVLQEDKSNKRSMPPPWHQTKRKQQRSQQRAFASKRDNPFAHFQHDPNDAESYLEGLSLQSQSPRRFQNSLIPQSRLDHLQQHSNQVNRPPRQTKTWGFGRHRMDRRRRNNGVGKPFSNQELLRIKADESQAQFAARRWSHPNREVDSIEYVGAPIVNNSYSNFEHSQTAHDTSWLHDHRPPMFEQPFDPRFQPSIAQPEAFTVPITQTYQGFVQEEVSGSDMTWGSPNDPSPGSSCESTHQYSHLPNQQLAQSSQIVPPSQSSVQIIPISQLNQRGWSQQADEESQFREVFF
ncbi:unnamed protein product [Cylindrotheca closterium]|uniref:DNA 3'-5' helicase n=1 Tax=Cylindrotheca closterium TaxID=2856 RepID=A0AAD2CIZ6_9STRA|nr:unnamed protein product [Cylindrotheca closterium]